MLQAIYCFLAFDVTYYITLYYIYHCNGQDSSYKASFNSYVCIKQITIHEWFQLKLVLNIFFVQHFLSCSQRLYGLGARKMILVGIGPLGCIPSQLSMVVTSQACVERVNSLVSAYNTRLIHLTNNLNQSLPGSFFVYQDIYTTFYDMVINPSKYGEPGTNLCYRAGVSDVLVITNWGCICDIVGFTVANQACCGNGRYGGELSCLPLQTPCPNRDQHIFWDSFHPTQAANAIVARGCYTETGTSCHPMSIPQLARI